MKLFPSSSHLRGALLLAVAACLAHPVQAGSFSDRRESAAAESAKPQAVSGGEKFSAPLPYEKTFEAIVTTLQKADNEVSDANKDGGLIATAIKVEGGWKQTGTRTVVTVIRDTDTSTIVKVVVTEQKRYKALQVEPWSEPKANAKKTAEAAVALKTALGGK